MVAALEHLLDRFKRDPNANFSSEEMHILEMAAEAELWAAKAVAVHYAKKGDFGKVLGLAKRLAETEPTSENLINLAATYRGLKDYVKCIDVLKQNAPHIDPVRYHDLMCSSWAYLGKVDEAIHHGDKALELKDQQAGRSETSAPPILRAFNKERRERNVISFSVWGTDLRYLQGALNNAIVARYLYPSWTARFYTDGSTPTDFRSALVRNAAQVVMVPDLAAATYGTFWRFLVEDDESVDFYLVRDADLVLNIKERWAVTDWLRSPSAFHIMRDELQHSELILAGMWGAHRGNIGGIRKRIIGFCGALPKIGNYLHADQHFLRSVVWPIARKSVLVHDRYFSFLAPRRYDADYELPARMHIGQNDWAHWRRT